MLREISAKELNVIAGGTDWGEVVMDGLEGALEGGTTGAIAGGVVGAVTGAGGGAVPGAAFGAAGGALGGLVWGAWSSYAEQNGYIEGEEEQSTDVRRD